MDNKKITTMFYESWFTFISAFAFPALYMASIPIIGHDVLLGIYMDVL